MKILGKISIKISLIVYNFRISLGACPQTPYQKHTSDADCALHNTPYRSQALF